MVRILLVDDSAQVVEALSKLLVELPHVELLRPATSVREATEFIVRENPDFLILDFRLTDGTALDILKYINSNKIRIEAVIFSSFSATRIKEECFAEGAKYFFSKPNDVSSLLDCIRQKKPAQE